MPLERGVFIFNHNKEDTMSKEVPYHKKPLGQIRADAKKIFGNPYRYVPEEMSYEEAMTGKGDYVGGEHYNRLPDQQQPAEIAHAWGLDFLLWNTVKYLSRAGHFEEVTNRLKISYEQLYDMHLIMFNELPIFKATDIFGYTKEYMYNTYTNRIQEVKNDEAL